MQSDYSSPQAGKGTSSPLGATVYPHGVNFSIFSKNATAVELLLFNSVDDDKPQQIIKINPITNRTYHYWHTFVPDIKAGQIYAYRVYGPSAPQIGMRFDPAKVVLDPYSRGVVVPKKYNRGAACRQGDNTTEAMKSVVVDPDTYDWQGDMPLKRPAARTVIYEMHVRGFTRNPNSGIEENKRGTYLGLIEKIPYLQDLGVSAVELLPIFQFDTQDAPQGRVNYWGYQPISFFAPHQAYSFRKDPLGPMDEFRDMVKALHRAGIEVILDVVFNHTSEGGENGPTLCFRGVDNTAYYILQNDKSKYADYTGCGNTLNTNHSVIRRMIVDSLCYWVKHMHVDGFRFDLASILSRDESGQPMVNPPVLWEIESNPVLAGTKLIAEAWDAAGLYQVGNFIGDSWKEWNGRFRDDARRFIRGDNDSASRFADRLIGSPDIFKREDREAEQSINFVTCHDGFTLNDLVSYNHKHNEANGENNRDGMDENFSWNCGVEGPTDNPGIEKLRNQQVKNFFTVTMLSIGVPMILMGDEVRRTQNGNNNAFCHDNEINWFDWSLLGKHADIYRFVKLLITRRLLRDVEHEYKRISLSNWIQQANKTWHGVKLNQPDWGSSSRTIAFSMEMRREKIITYIGLNSYSQPLDFELPLSDGENNPWRRWIDTSLDSPNDIVEWQNSQPIKDSIYNIKPHSVIMLFKNFHNE